MVMGGREGGGGGGGGEDPADFSQCGLQLQAKERENGDGWERGDMTLREGGGKEGDQREGGGRGRQPLLEGGHSIVCTQAGICRV